jgi:hypothetical protein
MTTEDAILVELYRQGTKYASSKAELIREVVERTGCAPAAATAYAVRLEKNRILYYEDFEGEKRPRIINNYEPGFLAISSTESPLF